MAKDNIKSNTDKEVKAQATVSVTLMPGQTYAKSNRIDILTGYAKVVVQNKGNAPITAVIVDPAWIDEAVKIWTVNAGQTLNTRVAIKGNTYHLELSNFNRAGYGTGTLSPA